jgi:hypothetical protein
MPTFSTSTKVPVSFDSIVFGLSLEYGQNYLPSNRIILIGRRFYLLATRNGDDLCHDIWSDRNYTSVCDRETLWTIGIYVVSLFDGTTVDRTEFLRDFVEKATRAYDQLCQESGPLTAERAFGNETDTKPTIVRFSVWGDGEDDQRKRAQIKLLSGSFLLEPTVPVAVNRSCFPKWKAGTAMMKLLSSGGSRSMTAFRGLRRQLSNATAARSRGNS